MQTQCLLRVLCDTLCICVKSLGILVTAPYIKFLILITFAAHSIRRLMYKMPYYTVTDNAILVDFMKQYPFAIITANGKDGVPVASHIPLLVKEREGNLVLQGHIMRKTDHHIALETAQKALAVFSGPHAYISASWYADPLSASTWNYMTVHASGNVRFTEHEELLEMLKELTAHFEAAPLSPARYELLPEEYVARLSKAIIGFEIVIDKIEGVFKLSQNKDQVNYERIIDQLMQQDSEAQAVVIQMQKRKAGLFPSEK